MSSAIPMPEKSWTVGNVLSICSVALSTITIVVYVTREIDAIKGDARVQDQKIIQIESRIEQWKTDHDLLIEIRTDQKRILDAFAADANQAKKQ